jgi:hypothetical protein
LDGESRRGGEWIPRRVFALDELFHVPGILEGRRNYTEAAASFTTYELYESMNRAPSLGEETLRSWAA